MNTPAHLILGPRVFQSGSKGKLPGCGSWGARTGCLALRDGVGFHLRLGHFRQVSFFGITITLMPGSRYSPSTTVSFSGASFSLSPSCCEGPLALAFASAALLHLALDFRFTRTMRASILADLGLGFRKPHQLLGSPCTCRHCRHVRSGPVCCAVDISPRAVSKLGRPRLGRRAARCRALQFKCLAVSLTVDHPMFRMPHVAKAARDVCYPHANCWIVFA